ncbi:MAG: HAD-IIIA family hydrolase [Nitrospirota bacterium]|nr:HAD-IIIA family hydrolase [Nitrospirota bacterium]
MAKHIIIDRDGTLIEHIPYLCDPEKVRILPTVKEGLQILKQSGCRLFLHTNQSGVGRGYFSYHDAERCNQEMLRQIGLGSDLFERVCMAPESPEQPADYRKPSSKFGREIMAEYGAAANDLCYIGDNVTDLLTAKKLGCGGIGVDTALHDLRKMLAENDLSGTYPVVDSFLEAATYAIRR